MHAQAEAALETADRSPRAFIGRSRTELPTPALVLDAGAMRENIATMASWTRGHAAIRAALQGPQVAAHRTGADRRGRDRYDGGDGLGGASAGRRWHRRHPDCQRGCGDGEAGAARRARAQRPDHGRGRQPRCRVGARPRRPEPRLDDRGAGRGRRRHAPRRRAVDRDRPGRSLVSLQEPKPSSSAA